MIAAFMQTKLQSSNQPQGHAGVERERCGRAYRLVVGAFLGLPLLQKDFMAQLT